MDIYEESVPDYTDYEDYTKYYVDDIDTILNQPNKIFLRKIEDYKLKHYLFNLHNYITTPEKIKDFLQITSQQIQNNEESIQILYIKTINNLIVQITSERLYQNEQKKVKKNYLNLFINIIDIAIKLISSLQENISNEYVKYMDKITDCYVENGVFFNISNNTDDTLYKENEKNNNNIDNINNDFNKNLIEFINSLGKFGQEKKNRRMSLYFCSKILMVCCENLYKNDDNNNDNNENLNKIIDRLLMLFEDCEKIIRFQAGKLIEKLLPILNILVKKEKIKKIIENLIKKSEDQSVKIVSLYSLFNNLDIIYDIYKDSYNEFDEILSKIVNCFKEIIIYDNDDDNENNNNNDNNNIDNTINLLKFIFNFIIDNNNKKRNEKIYYNFTNQINKKKIYDTFLEKKIFVERDILLNIEKNEKYYKFFFENFDLFMESLFIMKTDKIDNKLDYKSDYKLEKVDKTENIKNFIIEKLINLINNSKIISNNNNKIKLIYDLFINNLSKSIKYLSKNDIDLLIKSRKHVEDIIQTVNFPLIINGINKNNIHILLKILKFFNTETENSIKIIEIFTNYTIIPFVKGIIKSIKLIGEMKIKDKNEILKYFFNSFFEIIKSRKFNFSNKKKCMKILCYVVKYNSNEYYLNDYFNDINNEYIINEKSYYNKRILFVYYKMLIKIMPYNFIKERKIIDRIINDINCSNIPIELCQYLDVLNYKNFILFLDTNNNNNSKVNIVKILENINKKNEDIFKEDIELRKKVNKSLIILNEKQGLNELKEWNKKKEIEYNNINNINSNNIKTNKDKKTINIISRNIIKSKTITITSLNANRNEYINTNEYNNIEGSNINIKTNANINNKIYKTSTNYNIGTCTSTKFSQSKRLCINTNSIFLSNSSNPNTINSINTINTNVIKNDRPKKHNSINTFSNIISSIEQNCTNSINFSNKNQKNNDRKFPVIHKKLSSNDFYNSKNNNINDICFAPLTSRNSNQINRYGKIKHDFPSLPYSSNTLNNFYSKNNKHFDLNNNNNNNNQPINVYNFYKNNGRGFSEKKIDNRLVLFTNNNGNGNNDSLDKNKKNNWDVKSKGKKVSKFYVKSGNFNNENNGNNGNNGNRKNVILKYKTFE